MDRRQFLRIAGGGIVLAAGAGVAGCTSNPPDEAIVAWQGPRAETDVRRWVLGYAILAPHSHNLQSWLVDLSVPDEITLRCDLNRLLPETDPYSRQIMMSHGTFLELLDLAARERGLRADIALFPEGAFGPEKPDQRPVARIRLTPDGAVKPDPLFAQILQRHTNRQAYDAARAVPDSAWQAMAQAAQPHPLRFGYVGPEAPVVIARHRAIAAEAWRIELSTPRTVMESYRLLRIGNEEVARHRDGITLLDPEVVWLNRMGMFDRSKAPAPDDLATTSQIEDFGRKLTSTQGFLWLVSDGNTRETQISAGRAYVRVQLAATAHGIAMQPLQQALQEYPEVAQPYRGIHQLLQATQPAHTVQMWARVGYAPAVSPAPRRGLDAQLVKL
ncbi:hypothetical protein IGB42_01581 [Andreprevotia sp. IGB-42]|uniref:Acg family FMN-binding oxidoreductase n=1 Tax=Andreprevotia sp. IGB-42 TaxID=2497473 RepID=UPI001356E1E9|nr:twin-arginine translocation pathway signal protein [Andreprevotia sp. IGB-42]KAF0813902.1 hypothetical protein IGB42_01581 [Andreprevotia sp. IGB-42]